MDLIKNLINPISIFFIVLILGYYLGRVKCFGISLDLSGVLIVAVFFGYIIIENEVIKETMDLQVLKDSMQILSSLGTAMFVSVIGITTGYSFNLRSLKNARALFVGSAMVISSFALMKLIFVLDKNISYSKLLGALCGALTTTPGLSAATELNIVISEEATVAYGCTYLLGVTATVLCVQILSRKSVTSVEIEKKNTDGDHCALGGLIQIGFAIVFGQLLGGVHFGTFSLGQSGGILCIGIVLGVVIKKLFVRKIASLNMIGVYRNWGLIMFFVGNGVPAGMLVGNGFDAKIFIYGALMTVLPIGIGIILSKLILRDNSVTSVVAGGMTSTPAIGVILRKRYQVSLESYSMAYVGALLTIVLMIRIL